MRGIRWRLGASLLTVLTATIAVGAAALGPLYLRTAGDSVVRTTVSSAPINQQGVTLSSAPGQLVPLPDVVRAEASVRSVGGGRYFGPALTSVSSGVGLAGPDGSPKVSALFYRTGICNQLRMEHGSCLLGRGDVLVSGRTAAQLGVTVGDALRARVLGARQPLSLHVAGVYAVPNLTVPYWWGLGPEDFPFGVASGPNKVPQVDPLVVSAPTALAVPALDVPLVVGQVPLKSASVGLASERSLLASLGHLTARLRGEGVVLSTGLGSLLAGADSQRHAMATIVVIAALELVVLAVWVLGSLLVRSSEARQSEIRVARLRGFPPATLFGATAAEPALLCLLGLPLGVGAAVGATVAARDLLLDPRAAIVADGWVLVAVGCTLASIAGAVAVGTFTLVRSSRPAQPGRREAGALGGRTNVVADAILLVLSLVALVELGTNGALAGGSDPVASGAPGLIALGMAVVAVQLVLLAARAAVSASAGWKRVAPFLALRQVVRRPAVLRQARVLIIALGLACFATAAWSVARTNRATVARYAVGAPQVATVSPPPAGLVEAVDRADPGGHFAMAAVTVTTQSSTLLAVDSRRLPAVVRWPAGVSAGGLAAAMRAIDPPTAPVVSLSGSTVVVSATAAPTSQTAGMDLAAWIFNPQAGTTIIDLGPLRRGAATYSGSLAYACTGGCRLDGLGVVPAAGAQVPPSGSVQVAVTSVSVGAAGGTATPVAARLASWQAETSGVGVTAAGHALGVDVPTSVVAGYAGAIGAVDAPMAGPADRPGSLPAVVTSEDASVNGAAGAGGQVPAQGLDGNTLNLADATTASSLPRVGADAAMVDLGLLQRFQVSPSIPGATDQVWLGPSSPPDAVARLEAAGLRVESVQRASVLFSELERSGQSLADDFLLVATVAALLVAAASTMGALGATIRQRATELTSLQVAGVSRAALARSLALETGVLALTALFGTAAGVLAAVLALPSLPELASAPAIPLDYGLPGALVATVSAAVIVVVVLAGAGVAAAVLGRMSPSLLRTAPNDTAG